MDISVVIPLYNEEDSLQELATWIERVMNINTLSYEIIMVDDGSSDSSWDVIKNLSGSNKCIRAIHLRRNYGKSAALYCGFKIAKSDVVITMDADLQDSPDEIPELFRMIKEEHLDLVSGWKKVRHDPLSKTIPTKIYNGTLRAMSGIKLHDFNCGLKAYRHEVIKCVEVYGEMHRYIPYMAKKAGFEKIGEKIVSHQKRKYGKTKFGIERFINGPLDLLTIMFISKFGKRPMHFFGLLGSLMFGLGLCSSIYLGAHKLYSLSHHLKQGLLTESAYFYLALASMIIGTQLFLAGFIGELVSRNSSERNNYMIDKEI